MIETEAARRRTIARILAVNDTNPDPGHRAAMRAIVLAAVNEGFDALTNHTTKARARARQTKRKAQGPATDQ